MLTVSAVEPLQPIWRLQRVYILRLFAALLKKSGR
jgi:hypothetical protein